MSQREIEAHNRRELWRDVANHLTVAWEAVDRAQVGLDDLGLPGHAEQLDEIQSGLRRAANEASAKAGEL